MLITQTLQCQILAYCNQKGGVGKSTTVFHHAREAVKKGLKVLIVDFDPQGNLTQVVTAEPIEPGQAGIAEVISSRDTATLRDVIVPGIWEGLDVAPSTSHDILAAVREELVISGAGREQRLREALKTVAGEYDLILIDNAPSLDQLTINALTAATGAVIVTESARFALDGLAQVLSTINSVRSYYNPQLHVAGIVVNRHDSTSPEEVTWLREIRTAADSLQIQVLNPVMPKRVIVKKAMEAAVGIDEYGGRSASEAEGIYQKHLDTILTEGAQK